MKPAPFTWHAPDTIADAAQLLAELDMPKLLAGGQSLMPMLNMRYVFADHIIDLNRIVALQGIELVGDCLEIGAMTRQRALQRSDIVQQHMPAMGEALHWVGHVATRSRGTIGGSLSHLDPAAELPALLALHDGSLVVQSTRGTRDIAANEWFSGYMTPGLEADELLVKVKLPVWPKPHGFSFIEIARRHGDFAIAGAGALLQLNGAGQISRAAIVVFGAEVAPVRLRGAEELLLGEHAAPEVLKAAAEHAATLDAMDDVHCSGAYRRQVSQVLVRRALSEAAVRAKETG